MNLEPSFPTTRKRTASELYGGDEVKNRRRTKLTPQILPTVSPSSSTVVPPTVPPSSSTPISHPSTNLSIPTELGKLINRDVKLFRRLGWKGLVNHRRNKGDFNNVHAIKHPANRLLHHYKQHGVPVVTSNPPLSSTELLHAIKRGPHISANQHKEFLFEEFIDMINKEQWIILPFEQVKNLKGLRISPSGVVPQRERRPRWIGDYSWSKLNADTIDIAPLESMQFGRALERILREILLSDPKFGPIYLLKADISDGFYRIFVVAKNSILS